MGVCREAAVSVNVESAATAAELYVIVCVTVGGGGDANGELTVSVSAIVARGETSGISAASLLCSLWGRSTSGSEAVGDVDSTYIYSRMLKAMSNGATIFRVRIYILAILSWPTTGAV